ncbi:20461_t:CDS:2 [Dentiscutata erythropus]|uniref:20461_t:CDS:1 n=1 Tax=Dentiscutata erythropus TaxID=1348616 RepID=A0A9N9JPY1_9GLOM|nr:20461_t:CDS:2 [Dentiscutata erythropus]
MRPTMNEILTKINSLSKISVEFVTNSIDIQSDKELSDEDYENTDQFFDKDDDNIIVRDEPLCDQQHSHLSESLVPHSNANEVSNTDHSFEAGNYILTKEKYTNITNFALHPQQLYIEIRQPSAKVPISPRKENIYKSSKNISNANPSMPSTNVETGCDQEMLIPQLSQSHYKTSKSNNPVPNFEYLSYDRVQGLYKEAFYFIPKGFEPVLVPNNAKAKTNWLVLHKKYSYPTEEEKSALAKETRLNLQQISNWFINARRRHLPHLLESEFVNGNSMNSRRIRKIGAIKKPYRKEHPL